MGNLLIIGHGYTGSRFGDHMRAEGWQVAGTTREGGNGLIRWPGEPLDEALNRASHLLICAAPDANGDPLLAQMAKAVADSRFDWVGYLSTTGVYGDHGGGWVDENTPLAPATKRGFQRVYAESQWQALHRSRALPLHIFRLAGIYGPGRGPFAKVRGGTARRIIKKDQVFSRIHVDDIVQTLAASIARPNPGSIYNVCDNDPAPPQDVIGHAATLLGLPLPPALDFETADLTPMARSFYAESKKVSNAKIKAELGVNLLHPDYKSGLAALLKADRG